MYSVECGVHDDGDEQEKAVATSISVHGRDRSRADRARHGGGRTMNEANRQHHVNGDADH